jgi:hypothetical protein
LLKVPRFFGLGSLLLLGALARAGAAAEPEDAIGPDGGVSHAGAATPADLNRLLGAFERSSDSGLPLRASELVQSLGERATAPLIRAAKGPSRRVARWATGELETLGRKVPGDAVQTRSSQVLADVLRAYGDTRDADALPAVLSFVNSDRDEVRDAARQAVLTYQNAALAKLREAYANLLGHPAPDAWLATDVARELFATDDRFRLQDVYALMNSGLAEEAASDHVAATSDFEKVLARKPLFERRAEMVPAFVLAAQSKEDADPAAAAAYYRTAQRLSPEGPRASQARSALLYLEGEDLLGRGIVDESLFRLATTYDPGNLKAHAELARIEARSNERKLRLRRYAEGGATAAVLFGALALVPPWRTTRKRR